jgi:hypothetical protein
MHRIWRTALFSESSKPEGSADARSAKLKESFVAEWRNWQTHQTQNLAKFTLREGSTPSSATNQFRFFRLRN